MLCLNCQLQAQFLCCFSNYFCKRHLFSHISDKSKSHLLKSSKPEEPSLKSIKQTLVSFKIVRTSVVKDAQLIIQKIESIKEKLLHSLDKNIESLEKSLFLDHKIGENVSKLRDFELLSLSKESNLKKLFNCIEKHFKIYRARKSKRKYDLIQNFDNKSNLDDSMLSAINESALKLQSNNESCHISDNNAELKHDFDSKHSSWLLSIALSPKNDLLAVAEHSNLTRIFNIVKRTQEKIFKSLEIICYLEFSFDSKFLGFKGIKFSYILDLNSLQKTFIFQDTRNFGKFKLHPSMHQVIYQSSSSSIIISNYSNGLQKIREISGAATRNTKFFFLQNDLGILYNSANKVILHNFHDSKDNIWTSLNNIKTIGLSRNNEVLITLIKFHLVISDPLSFKEKLKIDFRGKFMKNLEISISKNFFILADKNKFVTIYDLTSGCEIYKMENEVIDFTYSHNDNCIYFLNIFNIFKFSLNEFKPCNFYPFSSAFDRLRNKYIGKNIILYPKITDFSLLIKSSNKIIKPALTESERIFCACLVESESLIILGLINKVQFWNFSTEKIIKEFYNHSEHIFHIIYSQHSLTAATGSFDSVVLYSIPTLSIIRVIKFLNKITKLRFSHFGNFLIGQEFINVVRVWSTADGKSDTFYFVKEGFISYSAISQDLSYFVMITNLGCAKVWDRRTKSKISEFNSTSSAYFFLVENPEFQKPLKKYLIR